MMARTKPRIELPFLTGGVAKKRRSFAARQLQGWFRTYPALRIAYAEARRRFVGVEGVCGMGVGRKFSESADRYGTAPESTGGLCLKVFVKIKKKEVSGRERIPAWIDVRVQRTARTTRVLLDVVSVGGTQRGQTGSGLQKGRGWPQAGRITPGRLFAFGTKAVDEMGDRPFRADEVNLGTTGAVIRFVNDRCYGISAGHVFTDPSLTVAPRPGCHPGLSLFSHAIDFASDVLCLSASSTKRSISPAEYLTDFPNFVKLGPKPFHRQAWSVETDTFNRSATCCSFKKTFIAFLQGKISIQPITIDAIDAPIA